MSGSRLVSSIGDLVRRDQWADCIKLNCDIEIMRGQTWKKTFGKGEAGRQQVKGGTHPQNPTTGLALIISFQTENSREVAGPPNTNLRKNNTTKKAAKTNT